MASDATPAYRGYRLQALYILWRILESEDSDHFIFQPEGQEDLAVFDSSETLLEVVQVKAHEEELVLSSLLPPKPKSNSPMRKDSFFYRIAGLLRTSPQLKVCLVSFGPIGPELLYAFQREGSERKGVARKLGEHKNLTKEDIHNLLTTVRPISVNEVELTKKVRAALYESLMGIDSESAFDLLSFWLYICAENKRKITRQDVIEKLSSVGRFLSECATHYQEWFTSIVPIEDRDIQPQIERLSEEYYQGVAARYSHILANLDIPRPEKVQDIAQKFTEHNVVIVHAASGQGKTTLAYRYLHDFFPDMWRFQVLLTEDREHALRIARALVGHADAINIPIVVYLDVSSSDNGWEELVKQLSFHQNIYVLVTIREEDLRRARIFGAEFQFSHVDLTFQNTEAQNIYLSFQEKHLQPTFLNFQEAWRQFGGEGPLMEFVYLVAKGNTLRERLSQQVRRLEDEVREGKIQKAELELLRLVSVASAYEARLKVKPLVEYLQLTAPTRTFQLLEKEYLLRQSADGSLVYGLHPLRSEILVNLLTDATLAPWSTNACVCIPFLFEADVETFFLYAFSRRQKDTKHLLVFLETYQPEQWRVVAGITQALLWLGIREYIDSNQQLIQEAFKESGPAWYTVLDFDVADAVPGSGLSLWKNLGHLLSQEGQQQIDAFQARQTDKKQIFARVRAWLSLRTGKPVEAVTVADWAAMAKTLFWIGRLDITWPVTEWIPDKVFEIILDSLPINVLADLIIGLSYGSSDDFLSWLGKYRDKLADRFRKETQTVVLEDDGQKLTAHFIVVIEPQESSHTEHISQAAKDRLHTEAIQHVGLLRSLLPDRTEYATQGYGHRLWTKPLPFDSTLKTGIPKSNLPLTWLTSINATFRGLGEMQFRLATWKQYAQEILVLRQAVVRSLKQLEEELDADFRNPTAIPLPGQKINADNWLNLQQSLRKYPLLPSCALDEWGFVDEYAGNTTGQQRGETQSLLEKRGLIIQEYEPFLPAFREYVRTLSNFFHQATDTLNFNARFGKGKNAEAERSEAKEREEANVKIEHLPTLNLADTIKILGTFQSAFRQLLSQYVDRQTLTKTEQLERDLFFRVWCTWYFFAYQPQTVLVEAAQKYPKYVIDVLKRIRSQMQEEFDKVASSNLSITIISKDNLWGSNPTLWLTINGESALDVYGSVEQVIAIIRHTTSEDNDIMLQQYIRNLYWQQVVIVPLVQGKSLNAMAWRIPFPVLLQEEGDVAGLNWWNLVLHPISPSDMIDMGLETWDNPRLDKATILLRSTMELLLVAGHLRDFKSLPEPDGYGEQLLQEYFQSLDGYIRSTFQVLQDAIAKIGAMINELLSSEHTHRPNIISAARAIQELTNLMMMPSHSPNKAEIGHKQLIVWVNQLEKAMEHAYSVYLLWATDVLDEANT